MKLGVLSLVLVVVSVGSALAYAFQAPAAGPTTPDSPFHQIAAEGGIIAINLGGNDAAQQVGLIDAEQRVLSVYRIDRMTGEIALQSVRKVVWDLQLDEFNGTSPLPHRLRDVVERN